MGNESTAFLFICSKLIGHLTSLTGIVCVAKWPWTIPPHISWCMKGWLSHWLDKQMRISSFVWVRLITLLSCLYDSKNGSVNACCFPELWPALSLTHYSCWRFFHRNHLTVALKDTAITLPSLCSLYQYSLPPIFELSGALLQVCWCTNSQCALFLSPHIHTLSLSKFHQIVYLIFHFIFSFFTHTSSLPKKWMRSFYYYSYHSNNLTVVLASYRFSILWSS